VQKNTCRTFIQDLVKKLAGHLSEGFNRPGNEEIDPQFRLWLSSKPDPSFPISILQTGMKMTVEPPQGLKANMLRAFGSGGTGVISERMFEDANKGVAWRKLLFGLCLFNSVIHERKKYGALGWNIAYEFNDSDLEVSILQLEMLLSEHKTIPWEALSYLIGGVTYGGRVTDEWDYRCLHALLGRFFCPESLQPHYSYSPNKIYQPVRDGMKFTDVVTYIESLPADNSADIFGMTTNAEKACREIQANDLMTTIISVQPRLSMGFMGTAKSSDEIVGTMAADILQRLPETVEEVAEGDVRSSTSSTLFQIHIKHILNRELPDLRDFEKNKLLSAAVDSVMGNSALVTVLRQEMDRYNTLLHVIHTMMRSLILAIKGEVIMSEPLEEAYNALLTQKVPLKWKSVSYESCKPLGSWVENLHMRVDFFAQWAELLLSSVERLMKPALGAKGGPVGELDPQEVPCSLPHSYWLSGFFFPQGFLTGVLQNHARKMGISVDSLQFQFRVLKKASDNDDTLSDLKQNFNIKETAFQGPTPPSDGVLIFGLYIDGARWDTQNNCVQDSLPGQRFARLPEIHFLPVQKQVSRADDSSSLHSVTKSPDNEPKSDLSPEEPNLPLHVYECPLYRTSERAGTLSSTGHSTNFVTAVQLPSQNQPSFWIMRGVALLCQPDE
ncbi:hypothetical protein DPMN_093722, partial [Dreissena polymorpha]